MTTADGEVRAVAARTARTSYGRLVAVLAALHGDLQLAEDALSGAFEEALRSWPENGVPSNPEGWLITVARNRQRDLWKSVAHRSTVPLAFDDRRSDRPDPSADVFTDLDPDRIPDRRLALLFVCAHPAIEEAIRTPLLLQTVLGFEAAQIAAAFAVAPAAMAQRLVRAKRRIRDTRIPFVVPPREVLTDRLGPVLEAVYGAFAIARTRPDADVAGDIADEAAYLAVTLAGMLPDEPEVWGLAAMITLARARDPGRRPGQYVPLDEQDPASWDPALIAEGEAYLRRAGTGVPGRFRLEAAIQAVHCARAVTGRTDWQALRVLYEALCVVAPTLGARVARASAVGHVEGPAAGLAALDGLGAAAQTFQPAWAVRAHLLAAAARPADARSAYVRAAALATDPAVREFLRQRAEALPG
ncbi:RNA polymerase sigma factor [Nakamurella deserti]|uniref:RNA polymerase sigma factor n=1 Tax=Nakamurella deserti TaxID=2164074 RepID=UPI00197BD7A3|nr:DUF6596 domain-containing protein [Nakamurella deserti]